MRCPAIVPALRAGLWPVLGRPMAGQQSAAVGDGASSEPTTGRKSHTLRAEPGMFGLVASDPRVSRTVTTLAKDAPAELRAIDTAGHRPASGCGS
jgi:hypothetical protein